MLSGLRAGRAATRLSLRSITRLVVCFKHPSIFHLALKSLSTMVKMQSLWLRPMMAPHRDITRLISMQFYRQLSNSPPRLCPNPSKWRNSHNLVNTLPHASPNTFSLSKVSRLSSVELMHFLDFEFLPENRSFFSHWPDGAGSLHSPSWHSPRHRLFEGSSSLSLW